ncbi:hypothetical protein CHISP_3093 [Chitinispirillum alkaliphilum]|nr:hypothetical protein CHISP_3093 [Chitinispirillum alkaliphilum]
MTKLQKFNNVIFAIFGSLGIALFILAILIMISYRLPSRHSRNAVLSAKAVEKLSDKDLIQQMLDLSLPIEIDSSKSIFIIPVSQKTLPKPVRGNKVTVASDFFESVPMEASSSRTALTTKVRHGDYNNLLIAKGEFSDFHLIFDNKVSINRIAYLNSPENPHLVIRGTQHDSNKDNVLTSEDLQELYLFNINKKKLTAIEFENHTVIDFAYMNSINKLIIRYGYDLNKDGMYNFVFEPTLLKSFCMETGKLESLIQNELLKAATNILIGKSSEN